MLVIPSVELYLQQLMVNTIAVADAARLARLAKLLNLHVTSFSNNIS